MMHVVTAREFAPVFKPWMEERLDTVFDDSARYIANVELILTDVVQLVLLLCASDTVHNTLVVPVGNTAPASVLLLL